MPEDTTTLAPQSNGHDRTTTANLTHTIRKYVATIAMAQARAMLELGANPMEIVDGLMDVCADFVARLDPAPARETVIGNIARNFPGLVALRRQAQTTTSGGIVLPRRVG